tara:strand:- start:4682 stop:4912 length:231 start_codon:yes stop_codon:yes gene_type:complete
MNKALEALKSTSLSLAQIANSVGYQNESTFSKAFRREYGVTPGLYRKSARSGRLEELNIPSSANPTDQYAPFSKKE